MSVATATETYFRYDGTTIIDSSAFFRITEVEGRADENWTNCLQEIWEEEREKRYCGTLDHVLSNLLHPRGSSVVEVTLRDGTTLHLTGRRA